MKEKQKTILIKILMGVIAVITLVFLIGPFVFPIRINSADIKYGATYSTIYADELGIDPVEGFRAIVEELGVSRVRIPVYWNRLEARRDVFVWDELDKMMEISKSNDVDVTLAIGLRVPRWPECFFPDWSRELSQSDIEFEQLQMIEAVVERYKDSSSILRWQVENEPFLRWFGKCPDLNKEFLQKEIELVESLDSDSVVMTTASGEQSLWIREARYTSGAVGVSVYRTVYNGIFGYVTYPIPSWIYRAKATMLGDTDVIVSELQVEPWFAKDIDKYTIDEQVALFDVEDFRRHISYVEKIGFSEVYIWGVEWWYFLKINGQPDLWDSGMMIF